MFLLIFIVHELGHFVAAKIFGVRLSSVTIGAGRVLKKGVHRKTKTPYFWCLWPISGHVELNSKDMAALSRGRRIVIILAGPAFNLILPFFILFPLYLAGGQPGIIPQIGGILVDGPADQAGLEVGDQIIGVDGTPVINFNDLADKTRRIPVQAVEITVKRGADVFETTLNPRHEKYRTKKGLLREHGRVGIQSAQAVYRFKNIKSVNGVDVSTIRDEGKMHAILKQHNGQTVIMGFEETDGNTHDYYTSIKTAYNPEWDDPEAHHHDRLSLGPNNETYYISVTFAQAFIKALSRTGEKIKAIAGVPFQLFPIDRLSLSFDTLFVGQDRPIKDNIYIAAHKLILLSVAIGLINLLPLPRLDGSFLLYELGAAVKKEPLTRKERARLLSFAFLTVYLSVVAFNFANMPHYFDKKIEAVTEWLEDRQTKR